MYLYKLESPSMGPWINASTVQRPQLYIFAWKPTLHITLGLLLESSQGQLWYQTAPICAAGDSGFGHIFHNTYTGLDTDANIVLLTQGVGVSDANSYLKNHLLKRSSHEIFYVYSFIHQTSPPGPLFHTLKCCRKWLLKEIGQYLFFELLRESRWV
jgi:hypothetical protein